MTILDSHTMNDLNITSITKLFQECPSVGTSNNLKAKLKGIVKY